MSRWIDADALIEHITNTADLGGWIGEALQQIKKVAIKYINLAPSIDIVRCKECKHCDTGIDEDGNKFWKCLGIHYGGVNPDDYCSYGEGSIE